MEHSGRRESTLMPTEQVHLDTSWQVPDFVVLAHRVQLTAQ